LAQTANLRDELRAEVRSNATTRKALGNLCWSSRHAVIPQGSDYALEIGRAIIRGIRDSCDYAKVPDVEG
jgi:hypothetical protein